MALLTLSGVAPHAGAEELSDSVELRFHCGSSRLDLNFGGNRQRVDSIVTLMTTLRNDSTYTIDRVTLRGSASPEGGVDLNRRLSSRRATTVLNYLRDHAALPDSLFSFSFTGRNWQGLRALVEADRQVPARAEVLALLDDIIATGDTQPGGRDRLSDLKTIAGGEAYGYLFRRYFPGLRRTMLTVEYSPAMLLRPVEASSIPELVVPRLIVAGVPALPEIFPVYIAPQPKPFYMALRTNLLGDALAIPNVGAEFYLGGNWSVGADWYYGWWDSDRRHRYWRLYGGDVGVRRWFGAAADRKPLTGHHVGVYAQMLIYDFEFGGKGQMAGKPGCNIWERANYGVGIEYGYSLPLRRRLNIDFTVGIGYLGGNYYEYRPQDGCYAWLSTKSRRWFGPTKAQVALVWLLGHNNTNKKGGKR